MNRGRLTGACYLGVFVAGYLYIALIPSIGLTGNNVDKGIAHTVAHPTEFWIGYAFFLVSIGFRLVLMLLFYELFEPVNKSLSRLAVFFNITATSVQANIAVFLIAPLALLTGGHPYLGAFHGGELHGLAAVALRLNYYGYTISLVFFAAYDLLIGYLALTSTFIPRIVGALLMVTGLAWLTYIAPNAAVRLVPVNVAVAFLGEAVMIVWLLLRGVDEEKWSRLSAARSRDTPSGIGGLIPST